MLKRLSICLFVAFIFSMQCNAQAMTSRTLLNNLEPFWFSLETLRKNILETTGNEYTSTLQQSYGFIILELRNAEQQLFLQVKFQIQFPKKLTCYSFYCEEKNMATKIKAYTDQLAGDFEWNESPESTFKLTPQQIQYLEMADRIASPGNDINATPSSYGSVIITSEFIKFEQINHMNSTSLDHKDSYSLRDLYFIIPLKGTSKRRHDLKIGSYYLGEMEVFFQDGSAKTQRATGDQIMIQLREAIKNQN